MPLVRFLFVVPATALWAAVAYKVFGFDAPWLAVTTVLAFLTLLGLSGLIAPFPTDPRAAVSPDSSPARTPPLRR
jgi:hypothetical protein